MVTRFALQAKVDILSLKSALEGQVGWLTISIRNHPKFKCRRNNDDMDEKCWSSYMIECAWSLIPVLAVRATGSDRGWAFCPEGAFQGTFCLSKQLLIGTRPTRHGTAPKIRFRHVAAFRTFRPDVENGTETMRVNCRQDSVESLLLGTSLSTRRQKDNDRKISCERALRVRLQAAKKGAWACRGFCYHMTGLVIMLYPCTTTTSNSQDTKARLFGSQKYRTERTKRSSSPWGTSAWGTDWKFILPPYQVTSTFPPNVSRQGYTNRWRRICWKTPDATFMASWSERCIAPFPHGARTRQKLDTRHEVHSGTATELRRQGKAQSLQLRHNRRSAHTKTPNHIHKTYDTTLYTQGSH